MSRNAHPDHSVTLLRQHRLQTKLTGDDRVWLSRDFRASTTRAVTETMVGANDFVTLHPPHADRYAAMNAEVARGDNPSLGAIKHQFLVEKHNRQRLGWSQVAGQTDRMPVVRKHCPV